MPIKIKKIKNKKAIAFEQLGLLILVGILAIVLGGYVIKFGIVAREKEPVERCRASLMIGLASPELLKQIPIDCDRMTKIIRKKDVVEKGKINQDKAAKIIADELAKCWYMVGEGKVDPFKRWDEEKSYCLVCSTIKYDEALIDFINKTPGQFIDANYLIKWMSKNKIPGKAETYTEYVRLGKEILGVEKKQNLPNKLPSDMLIFIAMHKKVEKEISWWDWIAIGVGATVALAIMLAAAPVTIVGLVATGVAAVSAALAVSYVEKSVIGFFSFGNNFDRCYLGTENCTGYGGIQIITKDVPLTSKVSFKGKDEKEHEDQLCHDIVN